MTRAVAGHEVIPMTRMMFSTDGPSTAASAIASGRNGITRNHSVTRMSTPPTRPPKNPATMPTHVPITIASTVAVRPMSRLIREPQTNCVQRCARGGRCRAAGTRPGSPTPGWRSSSRRRGRHGRRAAARPAPSATISDEDDEADHARRGCAGTGARPWPPSAAAAATRCGARRGGRRALMSSAPAGRGRRRAGRR